MYTYCGKRAGHAAAYAGLGTEPTGDAVAPPAPVVVEKDAGPAPAPTNAGWAAIINQAIQQQGACMTRPPSMTVKRGYTQVCDPKTGHWTTQLSPQLQRQRELDRLRAMESRPKPVAELARDKTKAMLPKGLLQNPMVIGAGLIAAAIFLRR